ncbi:recombinase family protein [Alteribacter natronophilus]|nr:recombinase family protein [Alteribacter natronophilus]
MSFWIFRSWKGRFYMTTNQQNSKEPKKIGVACLRRSKDSSQDDSDSLKTQALAIKDFASRNGFEIPEAYFFSDDGVSAYKKKAGKRSGLQKMKKVILENEVDGVFFYDTSRMDRTGYSFVTEFYNDVFAKKPDMKFYVTTQMDEWNPHDLKVKLELIVANSDSGMKSRRSIDLQITDLNNGVYPGSRAPFGYKLVKKDLIPTEKAEIVRLIYFLFSWGHGVATITKVLNDAGIPSSSNKKWKESSVHKILDNDIYKGDEFKWSFEKRPDEDSRRKGRHQGIVPKALNRINKVILEMKKKKYTKMETPFIFSNLLKCGKCGNRLKQRNGSTKGFKYLYYQCTSCSYKLDMNRVNEVLLNKVGKQMSLSLKLNEHQVQQQLQNYYDELNKRKHSLELEIKRIEINQEIVCKEDKTLSFIYDGALNNLVEKVKELEQCKSDIQALLHPEEIQSFVTLFRNLKLNEFARAEQRVLMLTFLRDIVVTQVNQEEFTADVTFKVNPVQAVTAPTG